MNEHEHVIRIRTISIILKDILNYSNKFVTMNKYITPNNCLKLLITLLILRINFKLLNYIFGKRIYH